MTSLAGAAVALVILVDLATGQGPPVYTNYLESQKAASGYGPPPPLPPIGPMRLPIQSYGSPSEYEGEAGYGKKVEKEYIKEDEHDKKHFLKHEKLDKKYDKEYEEYKTTPAPGMFGSLSNSMSGVWNRFG